MFIIRGPSADNLRTKTLTEFLGQIGAVVYGLQPWRIWAAKAMQDGTPQWPQLVLGRS